MIKFFKSLDGYKKRGIVYMTIGILLIAYELFFVRPLRPTVLILWVGVIGIGAIVILYFCESKE
jgi:hypothetical protein